MLLLRPLCSSLRKAPDMGKQRSIAAQLAVVILTKNEARHIGDCLHASSPTPLYPIHTAPTAQSRSLGSGRRGVAAALRQFASSACCADGRYRGVFFVDADERIPPEWLRGAPGDCGASEVGWWCRGTTTRASVCGSAFLPDYQLRLLRRGHA